MKKLMIPYFIAISLLLWNCNRPKDQPLGDQPERKPVLSLPDLKINQLVDSNTVDLNELLKLRGYDQTVYMALLKTDAQLPKQYFYSRPGSCCPCSSGGMSCCSCSGGSGFASPSGRASAAMGMNTGAEIFRLTKNNSLVQTVFKPLAPDLSTIEGIDVFVLPDGIEAGKYVVKFRGEINLAIYLNVESNGSFEIERLGVN